MKYCVLVSSVHPLTPVSEEPSILRATSVVMVLDGPHRSLFYEVFLIDWMNSLYRIVRMIYHVLADPNPSYDTSEPTQSVESSHS